MIKIKILKDDKDNYIGFASKGHADFDAYGKDIICAAVSVLMINTINAIETLTKDAFDYQADDPTGFLEVTFEQPISDQTKLLLDALVLGLNNIKDEYGTEYIELVIKEV